MVFVFPFLNFFKVYYAFPNIKYIPHPSWSSFCVKRVLLTIVLSGFILMRYIKLCELSFFAWFLFCFTTAPHLIAQEAFEFVIVMDILGDMLLGKSLYFRCSGAATGDSNLRNHWFQKGRVLK